MYFSIDTFCFRECTPMWSGQTSYPLYDSEYYVHSISVCLYATYLYLKIDGCKATNIWIQLRELQQSGLQRSCEIFQSQFIINFLLIHTHTAPPPIGRKLA